MVFLSEVLNRPKLLNELSAWQELARDSNKSRSILRLEQICVVLLAPYLRRVSSSIQASNMMNGTVTPPKIISSFNQLPSYGYCMQISEL